MSSILVLCICCEIHMTEAIPISQEKLFAYLKVRFRIGFGISLLFEL